MPNELGREKSPYLLQHAHNPVHWKPWGPKAFEEAKHRDVPVILSIGYSTCHWCHVMETESFENPNIADLMNAHFVNIKVDREERPDVDQIYMGFVMAMTGAGGWPMTVFLTPEAKPFFGGTYFPPEDRYGRPGFASLLVQLRDQWTHRREAVLKSGNEIFEAIRSYKARPSDAPAEPNTHWLDEAFEALKLSFDDRHGGFGSAPKFPRSHDMGFLLRYFKRTENPEALTIVEKSLEGMARGGIQDQLEGGFHRYSVDEAWRLPHFEKMLYDQALIARSYLETYQLTRNTRYASIARGILDYVLKEMSHPEGGFYSAEDADSLDPSDPPRKKEGAFYLWTLKELKHFLGEKGAELFAYRYGAEEAGNAPMDPHQEFGNGNILFEEHTLEETAARFGRSADEAASELEASRLKLQAERSRRPRPYRDDKILLDWNALMISSMALASGVLSEPLYGQAASKAAEFLIKRLKNRKGEWLHRWRDGEGAVGAMLDDLAFLLEALLQLYEQSLEDVWLKEALQTADSLVGNFWDEKEGGFFLTRSGADPLLILRPKEYYDGALPSGNSVAALALLKLGRISRDRCWEDYALKIMASVSAQLKNYPHQYCRMLEAVDFYAGPSREIIIAPAQPLPKGSYPMKETLFASFVPNKVVLRAPDPSYAPVGGQTAVYICRDFACQAPVTGEDELRRALEK